MVEDEEDDPVMEASNSLGSSLRRDQLSRGSCLSSSSEASSCSSGSNNNNNNSSSQSAAVTSIRSRRLDSLGIVLKKNNSSLVERADSGVGSEAGSSSSSSNCGSVRSNRTISSVLEEQAGVRSGAGERCQDCNLWMDKDSARYDFFLSRMLLIS